MDAGGGPRRGQPGCVCAGGLLMPSRCHPAFQEQVTAAVAHALEQQMQKLLEETQLDMNEFDNLLQPIIDTCTKDAISVRTGRGRRRTPRIGCSWGGGGSHSLSGPGHPVSPPAFCLSSSVGSPAEREGGWVEIPGHSRASAHPQTWGSWPHFTHCPGCCRPGRTGCSAMPSPRRTAN